MQASVRHEEGPDEELARRAGRGDRDALATLYDRHYRELFDLAARMLRHREAAEDVVQTVFVKAWSAFSARGAPSNVRAWLFAVARNAAIDELRHRKRQITMILEENAGQEDEGFTFTAVDSARLSDPEALYQVKQYGELVWSSAKALGPQDYLLLDLHLRKGFDADELAVVLGLQKGAVYTRLSRLKDSLEESVTTLLLLRRRRDCPQLDQLLTRLGATRISRSVRKEVSAHVKECERCEKTRRQMVSPAEIFAGFAPLPILLDQKERIWGRIISHIEAARAEGNGQALLRRLRGLSRVSRFILLGLVSLLLVGGFGIGAALVSQGPSVRDPSDIRSTSHAIGVESTDHTIDVVWEPQPGTQGFSIIWTEDPSTEPDTTVDLPGSAEGATSPVLADGSWHMVLRTTGGDGAWTATARLGPFPLVSPQRSDVFELTVEVLGSGTVTSSPAGINCEEDCSESYPEGAGVTLAAIASPGSRFHGWTGGGCSGTGTCTVTMDQVRMVRASFGLVPSRTFNLKVRKTGTGSGKVTSSPGGVSCGSDCSQRYSEGTKVLLTAAASSGSRFDGWIGGGCSGAGNCTVTMDKMRTVTASFSLLAPRMFTLSVSIRGPGSGVVVSTDGKIRCPGDCTASYKEGRKVTLRADPDPRWAFSGWGGACSGRNPTCTVTMSAERTVTARFDRV